MVCLGGIEIKCHSTFGLNLSIFSASMDYNAGFTSNATVDEDKEQDICKIFIGPGSIVGANSTILPGASIQIGGSLGAHSLLKTQIKEYEIFAGIPAKKIGQKNVFSSEILNLMNN